MKKKYAHFPVTDPEVFKIKMLNWVSRFNIFCFLDNNQYSFEPPAFDYMVGAGAADSISVTAKNIFEEVKTFSSFHKEWLFGHFNYPSSAAQQPAISGFEDAFFFVPQILIRCSGKQIYIESTTEDVSAVYDAINNTGKDTVVSKTSLQVIQASYTKQEYLTIIKALQQHIRRGDCYEINFCQDFFLDNITINPVAMYRTLSAISPAPFAAFYRINDKYCLCASPERFLQKKGNTIISQPIKGTSKRDLLNAVKDEEYRQYLLHSSKEKSENVMIVDLVRNDLSRICEEGSVRVKELFGIYSFPQVHQMISTIEGRVHESLHWCDIIAACFPMGSMTGAPKVKVMELISRYERVNRGLFSGCIGYVTPENEFDFNVVIRSLFYNESNKTISFKAGSGITFYADAESEYEECMMKAKAMQQVLQEHQ